MRLQLDTKWSDTLRQLPENGMGFQRVDIVLRGGHRVNDVLVFNSEEIELPDSQRQIRTSDIVDIKLTPRIGNTDYHSR